MIEFYRFPCFGGEKWSEKWSRPVTSQTRKVSRRELITSTSIERAYIEHLSLPEHHLCAHTSTTAQVRRSGRWRDPCRCTAAAACSGRASWGTPWCPLHLSTLRSDALLRTRHVADHPPAVLRPVGVAAVAADPTRSKFKPEGDKQRSFAFESVLLKE